MTGFTGSPRLLKGGIAQLDPATGAVLGVIVLQYNPETVTRTLQPQAVGEDADRSEALRLKAPPTETIKVDVEIDAADQLELPDRHPTTAALGIHPQLATLEGLVYPTVAQLERTNQVAGAGTLEIAPAQTPLTVLVWSRERSLPVRVTELSITEEAFDPALNPLRAKVGLGLRVLNVNDLGFEHRGGNLYLSYQRRKEQLAARGETGALATLGIGGIG